jgi:hypothetical protein
MFFFQNNKSKSLSLDLSNLNTASFKNLLEEVVAYDTAKQTKSELYNVCIILDILCKLIVNDLCFTNVYKTVCKTIIILKL